MHSTGYRSFEIVQFSSERFVPERLADRATALYMRPVGRAPSNFGDHGDQVYLVPFNVANCLSLIFIAWHCVKLAALRQTCLLSSRREEWGGKW